MWAHDVDYRRGEIDRKLTCYFGVPRYLLKNIFLTALSLPLKVTNRRELLKSWIQLSRQWGRLIEIRERL